MAMQQLGGGSPSDLGERVVRRRLWWRRPGSVCRLAAGAADTRADGGEAEGNRE
jgi:hypothetical protein